MSSSISTPDALSANSRRAACTCWRVIEAQHRVSTLKITDTQAEQEILERLIEASKPPVPKECEHLHYLLSTPFRYGAPYPNGSRFRRAGLTPGVFYASHHVETAIAETVFWRLLFYADSPQTPWPANAGEYTAFACDYATGLLTFDIGHIPAEGAAITAGFEFDVEAGVLVPAHFLRVEVRRVITTGDPVQCERDFLRGRWNG